MQLNYNSQVDKSKKHAKKASSCCTSWSHISHHPPVRPAGIVLLATARRSGCSPTRTQCYLVLLIRRTAFLQPTVAGSHWFSTPCRNRSPRYRSSVRVLTDSHPTPPRARYSSHGVPATSGCWFSLAKVRPAGIEPATLTLRVSCSAD